jgi:hypothetical protein
MSIPDFINKDNIITLWDVISDEDVFKFLSKDIQSNVYQVFVNNITEFYETEKTNNTTLIEKNKKYIILILNYIKKNYPEKLPNKIKILVNEPVKELITYEEIQNEKQIKFDLELNKLQENFNKSMQIKIPEVPDFADKQMDTPIDEIDKLVKEMTLKRNYELEEINFNHSNSEKQFKKNVSWGNNQEISFLENDDNFILNKLKKINPTNEVNSTNGINTTNDEMLNIMNKKIDFILDILSKNNLIK